MGGRKKRRARAAADRDGPEGLGWCELEVVDVELELHQLDLRYAGLRRKDSRRERSLFASLADAGQQVPVVVVRAETERFTLVDGYKRVHVLQKLHRDTVQAVLWELTELDALLLSRLMRAQEGDSPLEQGWLLRELHERFGLSHGELARRFDKTTSWVSRRLALVRELPEAIQELVRMGQLSAHAAMKHLVPLARANAEECLTLAPVLAGHGFSSRQVGTLCGVFMAGAEESKRLVLTQPELVLRAEAEAKKPKDRTPTDRVLSDVAALAAIARRARRLFLEERRRGPLPWGQTLSHALSSAEGDTALLFTALRKEVADA